jgi:lipopolysaccharide/colanic/teichoic acid biosynthesis glycosyltransferase
MYQAIFKRTFDIVLSFIVSILFFPFLVIISIIIKIDSRGPIFFKQKRVGKDLVYFNVLKLRTMTNKKRKVTDKPVIGKAEGVTRIGFFLRRFKIDELPQVFNVLIGDMSIVGPRPSIPDQLKKMTQKEKERYKIRPGLTGLSQVSGNIHIPWSERFKYDLKYVKNVSFSVDMKIIIKTFSIIFKGEDKFIHKSNNIIKNDES